MKPRWIVLPLVLAACADAATAPQASPHLDASEVSTLTAVLADAETRLLPALPAQTLPPRLLAELRNALASRDAGIVASSAAVVAAALPEDSADPEIGALRLAFDHVRGVAMLRLAEGEPR